MACTRFLQSFFNRDIIIHVSFHDKSQTLCPCARGLLDSRIYETPLIQSVFTSKPDRNTIKMAGFPLELFKVRTTPLQHHQSQLTSQSYPQFGMYVFFPIAFMGYFGTNLEERFAVPDFWPKPEEANKVPTEREEIKAELERLRARRLYLRDKRLTEEARRQAENPAPVSEGEQ